MLEDVLELTDHLGHSSPLEIGVWEESDITDAITGSARNGGHAGRSSKQDKNFSVLDSGARLTFDSWIQEVFTLDNAETMEKLSKAVMRNHMPINYRHSQTQLTPLMVAAGNIVYMWYVV